MFRILVYTIFLPIFIFVVSFFGFLYLKYPPESWKGELIKQIEEKLKAKIEIENIHYGFDGFLKIRGFGLYIVQDSSLKNNKAKNPQPDLLIDELGILFNPSSLWSQKLDIYSLYIQGLKAHIIQNKKKHYNWQKLHLFKELSKAAKKKSSSLQVTEENFFQNQLFIKNISLDDIVLHIRAPSLVSVAGKYVVDADIKLGDDDLQLEMQVKTPKKNRIEIDSTVFLPARLSQLIKNYKTIKNRIAQKKFPSSKIKIRFHNFQAKYVHKFLPKLRMIQYLNGTIFLSTISKKEHSARLFVKFHNTHFKMNKNYKKMAVSLNGALSIYLKKRKMIAKKMEIKIANKSFVQLSDLLINGNKNIQLKANIDLAIQDFKKYFDSDTQAEGNVVGNLSYGFANKPLKGSISLQDTSLSREHIPFLKKSNMTIKFLGNKIEIPNTTLTVLKQKVDFKAKGSLSKKKGTSFTYTLTAKTWNMNEVLKMTRDNSSTSTHAKNTKKNQLSRAADSFEKKNEEPFLLRSFLPVSLRGDIHFDSFLVSKLNFAQFSAKTSFKKRVLSLDKFRFSLEKGIFTGNYQIKFLKKNLHTFAFKIENLKLHKIFKKFGTKDTIYATSSGEFMGQMEGSSLAEFSQTLDSKIQMKASEGKMVNTFLQKGLLNGPLGGLESKLSHLEFLGYKANILTRQGHIYIESIKFVSNDFSFSVVGKFDWDFFGNSYMKLKFTDKFIENIASVVRLGIVSNKQDDQYVFFFSCLQRNILDKKCWQPDQ